MSKINESAKIVLKTKEPPFRAGTARAERFAKVRRYAGKPVSAFVAAGGRLSTLGNLRRMGVVALASK